jgi:hypothetical protein
MPINRVFQRLKKPMKNGFIVHHLYEREVQIWFMEYLVVVIVTGI